MSAPQKKVVIAGYVRSPFTPAHKGELKDVRSDELLAQTIRGLIEKTGVDPALIDDVKAGCAFPEGEQGMNLGRIAGLMAGIPKSAGGVTINRFCGSSMQAIHDAAGMIALGSADAVVACGVESMTRIPMGGYNMLPHPAFAKEMPGAYMGMVETAENVAKFCNVSRAEQEAFSLKSQFKTAAAQKAGRFEQEIIPIRKKDGTMVTQDGCIRPETTSEGLAGLKAVLPQGGATVTAGTSSPLTDGAAAVLVVSEDFALRHGLKIMAEIAAVAVAGCDPEKMGLGPIPATEKAIHIAGLESIDRKTFRAELNEAFAAQALPSIKGIGLDPERVNRDGGAIGMGHPLGASGARITGKLAQTMYEEGDDYGISSMCIGGGQGITSILKKYTPRP